MTASTLLAQYGVTVAQARTFIMSNLNNLSTILNTSKQFGVTNYMLAEIYGGVSGNDVRGFFSSHGLDSANLDTSVAQVILPDSTIRLISSSSSGISGNNPNRNASISSDGRYVAFSSDSSNLVSGDTNYFKNIFVKDTQTGNIELISSSSSGIIGNSGSDNPSISSDGRYVAFESSATNLVSGDTNRATDIFVKDTLTGSIQLISSSSSGIIGIGYKQKPAISADGRYVAFSSGDMSSSTNIFIKDTQTGTFQLVSSSSNGIIGNGFSDNPSFSADGKYVTFDSDAKNLVSVDTGSFTDIFIKDTQTGNIQLISSNLNGMAENDWSADPSISSDGRYVAFMSDANHVTWEIYIVGNSLMTTIS